MKVEIELLYGNEHRKNVTKEDVQGNINALQRAIDGKQRASDFVLLLDTKSILTAIQKKLP